MAHESAGGSLRRGTLKVYLGAAPGVGKTCAMLEEAHGLLEQNRDVVVGIIVTHGRRHTAKLVEGLEQVPLRTVEYHGGTFEELDVDAVIARRPEVVLVDELAHTIVNEEAAEPGGSSLEIETDEADRSGTDAEVTGTSGTVTGASGGAADTAGTAAERPGTAAGRTGAVAGPAATGVRTKRWQDIDVLLGAGIDVISTVNIQHLESLNDVVRDITGRKQLETVPDAVLRAADEIELVDLSPDALRIRLAKGLIYSAEKVDAALTKYFRTGNLTALRELALLWLADKVDEGLARYRSDEQIEKVWPTRERIVVAVTGGLESQALIRRGMRIAGRTAGRELMAVHVVQENGLRQPTFAGITEARKLMESFGGTWHTVAGDDIAEALLDFARGANATQLIIGASRAPWLQRLLGTGVSTAVVAGSGDIDIHIVTQEGLGKRPIRPPRASALPISRRLIGFGLAFGLPVILTLSFLGLGREEVSLSLNMLTYITAVVFVALIGGWWPAVTAALAGTACINWFFTSPLGTFTIDQFENIVALGLFLVVAAAVAGVVDLAARRAQQAAEARAQALLLSELAGSVIKEGTHVEALLAQVSEALGQEVACVCRLSTDSSREATNTAVWEPVVSSGGTLTSSQDATETVQLDDRHRLMLKGRTLNASESQILDAYAGRILHLLNAKELQDTRIAAQRLGAANAVRTALLTAVSHDLRTPLAGIKTAVSSLRMTDIELSEENRAEMLEAIEDSADVLENVITNLLDMSRIEAEDLCVGRVGVDVADVVSSALLEVGPALCPTDTRVEVAAELPLVVADYGLLQRVLVNLVSNAGKYGGPRCLIDADSVGDTVLLRVRDYGSGVSDDQKRQLFVPFKRFGDQSSGTGLGLGLAVAHGLSEAMGAQLSAEDTPGGGLTMVLTLPIADAESDSEPADPLGALPAAHETPGAEEKESGA